MKRIYNLDLIRTISIFPIVHFHSWELIFFEDRLLPELFTQPHLAMYNINMYFTFSGLTVVFLFYFLLGLKDRPLSSLKNKSLIFSLGLILLSTIAYVAFDSDFLIEWDIYHFLIFSFLVFVWISKKLKGSSTQVGVWLFLTCIPYWKLGYSGYVSDALIGNCHSGTGMWPLFPYLFFLFLAFSLGSYVSKIKSETSTTKAASILALGLLGLGVASTQYYRHAPIGPGFGCYIHRPPVWIWLITVLCMSFIFYGASNERLNKVFFLKRPGELLSKSMWNRKFGICYLTHWLFLLCLYYNKDFFVENPSTFFMAPLGVILITEVTVQFFSRLLKRSALSLR